MKKSIMLAVAAIVATAFFSCQSNSNRKQETEKREVVPATTIVTSNVYTGTLPAADGPGIIYKLTVNNMNNESGDFVLDMTYIDAEKKGENKTFTTRGKLKTVKGTAKSGGDKVYQLTDSDNEVTYFFSKRCENIAFTQ